jgi:NADH-quinone oxidoreductase subunit J
LTGYNRKFEARNPKYEKNSKFESKNVPNISKNLICLLEFLSLEIRICFEFRYSIFEILLFKKLFMTIYSIIFYILAILILVTTGLAITRRDMVHAVIYLIFSFFGSAMLFYLFGAPFLAVLEVIIYAGAIMVLFLFIVMMLKVETVGQRLFPLNQWLPAAVCGVVYLALGIGLVAADPNGHRILKAARAEPAAFGQYIFQKHWLSIEMVSLLLLVAVIGALLLARRSKKNSARQTIEGEL